LIYRNKINETLNILSIIGGEVFATIQDIISNRLSSSNTSAKRLPVEWNLLLIAETKLNCYINYANRLINNYN